MVQIVDIIHRTYKNKRLNRLNIARNYLFLTLGSTFIFACIYYAAQFIDPDTKSIAKKTGSRKSDRVENDNTDNDGDNNQFMGQDDKLSFFACLLFSLVTQTTVGFAWFVPTDNITRIIVFFQLIAVLCITTYTLI